MKTETEDKIQQDCLMWFNNNYCKFEHNPRCMIFSVPNGGKRDAREAKKLKNTGLLKGASDLVIVIHGQTIYSETKKPGGYQSPEQKDFQSRVVALGHEYIVYKSLDEFKSLIIPIVEKNEARRKCWIGIGN